MTVKLRSPQVSEACFRARQLFSQRLPKKSRPPTFETRDSSKASSDAMAAQIKTMSDQIAQLTKAMANKENTPNSGGSGGSGGGLRDRGQGRVAIQYEKPRSMGCYCFSHGFHPAGKNHTSANCQWKQPNHDAAVTWNARKVESMHWPSPIHVSIWQQNHTTYAGKSAPTN